jgi:hypothetical protein
VSQLRNDRLPEEMRMAWNRISTVVIGIDENTNLESDLDHSAHYAGPSEGHKHQKRTHQLHEVVAQSLYHVDDLWIVVEVDGQRVRVRLGLIVVVHAGEVSPALVASDLDHARAYHYAEEQPAIAPQAHCGRRSVGRVPFH